MEAGLNSDPGNDSFSDKIRDAKSMLMENGNATWCTITRVVLVGTPVGCLLAYNSG